MGPFGGFRVSCDLSLAERSPGHSVGANERRWRKRCQRLEQRGHLDPQGKWKNKLCHLCHLLFSVAKDDTTSPSYQVITRNGSLGEALSTAKAGASRNVGRCGGTCRDCCVVAAAAQFYAKEWK